MAMLPASIILTSASTRRNAPASALNIRGGWKALLIGSSRIIAGSSDAAFYERLRGASTTDAVGCENYRGKC